MGMLDDPNYTDYQQPVPALFADQNIAPPPQSLMLGAPSSDSSGIGMADTPVPVATAAPTVNIKKPPTNSDLKRQAYEQMSTGQKIGTVLGEFGAAVTGSESPLEKKMLRERQERALQAAELKTHVVALEDGVKVAKGLQGDAKKGFVDDYAAQLEAVRPGLGATFKHVSNQPDLLTKFSAYMPYLPDSVKILAQNDPNAFMAMLGKPEGIKILEDARNKYNVGFAGRQGAAMIANLQQLGLPEEMVKAAHDDAEKNGGKLSASMFNKVQDYLPAGNPFKISEAARQSINEHRESSNLFYRSLGVHSPEDESEIARKTAEAKDKLQPGQIIDMPLGGKNVAKAAYDPDKTFFPNAEHDANGFAILGKGTKGEGTTINMPGATGMGVNPADGKSAHWSLGKDGTVRWDAIQPLPKEVDPVKAEIAKLIAGGKKDNVTPAKPAFADGAKDSKGGTIAPAAELGVKHKFENDPAMKGKTLGAKTQRGYEVKDGGKLIGYFN